MVADGANPFHRPDPFWTGPMNSQLAQRGFDPPVQPDRLYGLGEPDASRLFAEAAREAGQAIAGIGDFLDSVWSTA